MLVTYVFIVITVIISMLAFNDASLINRLLMYPRIMNRPTEYYRLLTSGFVHADYNHLFFNMLTLFFFGQNVEMIIGELGYPSLILYSALYLGAIVLSSVPALIKNKNNPYYRSLGASGGVSAIVFFTVYYFPWSRILLFFLPMPAIVYAVLYIAYSYYMAKRGDDTIGHDAHLSGSLFGFIAALLLDPSHGRYFLNQIMHPSFSL